MSFMEAVLLGVALSMDSFAVSVTNGMQLEKVTLPYTLAVSLLFGAFQALMPLLGFFCGSFFMHISKRLIIGLCLCCFAHSAVK